MSTSLRFLGTGVALVLLACDTEILSPRLEHSSSSRAARAAATALSTFAESDTRIHLAWNDEARNEAGWEVHRSSSGPAGSFAPRATLGANNTSYTDTGLSVKTQYCYKVRSFRTHGAKSQYAPFTEVSCNTTRGPATPPSNTVAVPSTSRSVDVAWTHNAGDINSFRVERSGDPGGPWVTLAAIEAWRRSHADGNGVTPDKQVCYRVVAVNVFGEGISNVACTFAPSAPSSVSATSADAQSIDISWADASSVEDGYEIQRAASGGAWQVIADLPANATFTRDAGIAPGTVYQYRVRAKRDGGFSNFAFSAMVASASRIPDTPTSTEAIASGSTVIVVGWQNESPLATEFRIEASNDGRLTWSTVATVASGSRGVSHRGVTPEQEVCYRVIARNAVGDSPPSNVDCTRAPARPTNLVISMGDDNGWPTVLITWTDNSNIEEGYEIRLLRCWEGGCSFRSIQMVPNYQGGETSVFLYLDFDEFVDGVYAYYNGGYSDPAAWPETAGAAVKSMRACCGSSNRVPYAGSANRPSWPGTARPIARAP